MRCLGGRGRGPKLCRCRVLFLDGTHCIAQAKCDGLGQVLLDHVFKQINLVEAMYFGLRYLDGTNQTHWLDPNKKIAKQLKGGTSFTLYFGVKFYASDPCKLVEEITRYQFFLQLKQDILQGRLPVALDLAAELAASAVQSELGDYDPRRHSVGYVSEFQFMAAQSVEFENKAAEIHKTLSGQVPAVAEFNYLEKVKWLDMYGVDLHPVLGEDNVEYFLGLTPSGVIVLRNKTKVGNYFWPRITKVYFKGRYFMLRVRDKNNDESTFGFDLATKQASKHFWKCCVEHHAFFRLMQVNASPVGDLLKFTSKFKNTGQVEMQAREMDPMRPPPLVRRVPSQRGQRRLPPTDGIDNMSRDDKPAVKPEPVDAASTLLSSATLQSYPSMHRSTSVPVVLPLSDSPRSTRSAPWGNGKQRGLYSTSVNPSPRSVRSTSTKNSLRLRASQQALGSESSYNGHHHKHHHHRHDSENEGEYPKSPRNSHSKSRHRKNRSGSRTRDSGSESESAQKSQRNRHRLNNNNNDDYQLVSSDAQWCEVQRQQIKQPQSAVIKELTNSHHSGYTNSGMESESEFHYRHKKKYRRHSRSRSRSPDVPKRPSEELRKHLEFKLIDTSGFSEAQLKSIPYTRVESEKKTIKTRHSPTSRQKHKPSKHQKDNSMHKIGLPVNDDGNVSRHSVATAPVLPVSKMYGIANPSASPASSVRSIPRRSCDNLLSINGAEVPHRATLEISDPHPLLSGEDRDNAILAVLPPLERKIHHEMSTEL